MLVFPFCIKFVRGCDIVALTIRFWMKRLSFLYFLPARLQRGGIGLIPQLMPKAHGHAPVSHCA